MCATVFPENCSFFRYRDTAISYREQMQSVSQRTKIPRIRDDTILRRRYEDRICIQARGG